MCTFLNNASVRRVGRPECGVAVSGRLADAESLLAGQAGTTVIKG